MEYLIDFECSECSKFQTQTHAEMVTHILKDHPNYSAQEAEYYSTLWEQDAWDQHDIEEIRRSEDYL